MARHAHLRLRASYASTQSPLHRLDPRFKLVATLVLIVCAFFATNFFGLALYAAAVVALYAIARVPAALAWRTAAPLLLVAVVTALFNLLFVQSGTVYLSWGILVITAGGCSAAAFFGLRLALLVFVACLLMLTTTMLEITNASEALLAPLHHIGLPAHELALIAGIALRFLPEFATEFSVIRQAQMSRCARIDQGPLRYRLQSVGSLAAPLLRSAYRRSETLASAMESRCYHGAQGRTSLHPLRLTRADALAACVVALVCAAVVLSRLL